MTGVRRLAKRQTWGGGLGVPLLATIISLAVIGGIIHV
jgi:hypothetical protein